MPGYKQTEVGVIPEDWDALRLGGGIALLSGHHVLARYCNSTSGTPYITGPSDFASGKIEHTKFTTHPTTLCAANDILITVKGSGAGRMVVSDAEYCISRQLMAIRPVKWDGEYLFYSLLQNSTAISAASTGLIPGLSRGDVTKQLVPIPPLPEQRAIAAALADADGLIAALEGMIAKKRDLKQAAMQHLLTGKTRLPGFSGEWEVKRLGEIGRALIGLTYSPSDIRSFGTLVLRSSNIQNGSLTFDDNVYVDPEVAQSSIIEVGDLLICARNGSRDLIGKSVRLDGRARGMAFGAFMAAYRSEFNNFISLQFQSDLIKRQINEHLGATINQITNKSLLSFQVPLPNDSAEQTAIAEVLSDMDADLTALEAQAAKARAVKQGMMQELLTGRVRLI